jgi:hypothetical protein
MPRVRDGLRSLSVLKATWLGYGGIRCGADTAVRTSLP